MAFPVRACGKKLNSVQLFLRPNGQENFPDGKKNSQTVHAHVVIFPFPFLSPNGQVEIRLYINEHFQH